MSNTFKVLVALVMLAVVLPSFAVAFDEGRALHFNNETTTVNYATDYTVSVVERYDPVMYDNETVVDTDAGGGALVEGTDYDFFPSNGTLRWYNTNATTGGDEAYIGYYSTTQTAEQQLITSLLVAVSVAVAFLVLLVAVSYTFALAGVWTDGGGKE
jgi:ABC-type glycerol-3-phosphate transport system permease component